MLLVYCGEYVSRIEQKKNYNVTSYCYLAMYYIEDSSSNIYIPAEVGEASLPYPM
jgi:hypothetical protein